MSTFRFALIEQGRPDWERELECESDEAAIAEAHEFLAHQLLLRPEAQLRLSVARGDGAILGWCDPGGVFSRAPGADAGDT